MEKIIQKKIFQFNHVILLNQSISESIFCLVLFVEFLQIMFLTFYNMPLMNEFAYKTITIEVPKVDPFAALLNLPVVAPKT